MKYLIGIVALLALTSSTWAFHASVSSGVSRTTPSYCIVFDGNFSGSIEYETQDNKTAKFGFTLDETTVNTSGECNNVVAQKRQQELVVDFQVQNNSAQQQWKLTLTFSQEKDKDFKVVDVKLFVYFPESLNASEQTVSYVLEKTDEQWAASDVNGFSCSSSSSDLIEQGKANDKLKGTVHFDQLKVLAFAQLQTGDFPKDQVFEQCILDTKTSDLVPIIVGACLAGLVIIVLVAYLVGRARARRQGYASV